MNSSELKLHWPVLQSTKLLRFRLHTSLNTLSRVVPTLKTSQPSGIFSSAA